MPSPAHSSQTSAASDSTGLRGRRVSAVVNRDAGSLEDIDIEAFCVSLRDRLEDAGAPTDVVTASATEIEAAMEKAFGGPAEIVIIGGGDGTVTGAAALALRYKKVLGVIPLGTFNLMARDLDMPLDPDAAIAALAAGAVRTVDVGFVNGRLFLCQSGLGFFSRFAQARQRSRATRSSSKWLKAARALLAALRRTRILDVRVNSEGGSRRFRSLALLITINAYHRNPGDLLRRDRLDGGQLALYSIRYRTAAGLIVFALKLLLGRWHRDDQLEILPSRELTIARRRGRKLPVTLDGELLVLPTPLRYRLFPRALRVLGATVSAVDRA
jgi:diacylglycerol kinase family enzyme